MAGRNKLLQQCESIARSTGVRCRAKGFLKKKFKKYRCKNHGGLCEGATTLNGYKKALSKLKQFKNFTPEQINDYIINRRNNFKYYRTD